MNLVVLAGEEANAYVHREGADVLSNRETWSPTLEEFGAPNNFVGLDGERFQLWHPTALDQSFEEVAATADEIMRHLAELGA